MAITILASPESYAPAFNPIWWGVYSDQTGQPNFEFICDVYITGVTFAGGASFLRLKVPSNPSDGYGYFNVAPILRRQLSGDLGDTIYGFQPCTSSILDYSVKFGELYGPSSGVIAHTDLTTSTGKTAFNGSLQTMEWLDYRTADYVANTSATQINLLSQSPSSGTINTGYSQWIYAMSQTSGAIKFANINSFNSAGTLTNTAVVINSGSYTPSQAYNRMIRFPAGYNISQIPAGAVVSGTLANFLNTTTNARWEIYFTDSAHNRISKSFYSSWDTNCTSHTIYQIYFKNKLGGYDVFDFTRASQKSVDIKRSKFQKIMGRTSEDTGVFIYRDYDRFETNFYTEYKENIKLNSNWITETQSVWLQEMLTSPDIRMDIIGATGSHFLVPVNIIETNYTQRQHKTDKTFNIEINIQPSFKELRQGA